MKIFFLLRVASYPHRMLSRQIKKKQTTKYFQFVGHLFNVPHHLIAKWNTKRFRYLLRNSLSLCDVLHSKIMYPSKNKTINV